MVRNLHRKEKLSLIFSLHFKCFYRLYFGNALGCNTDNLILCNEFWSEAMLQYIRLGFLLGDCTIRWKSCSHRLFVLYSSICRKSNSISYLFGCIRKDNVRKCLYFLEKFEYCLLLTSLIRLKRKVDPSIAEEYSVIVITLYVLL